jgi:large subunit ribosomal protein L22
VNQIRGKGVEDALNLLQLSPKRVAAPIAKLLRSAVANAEQKNENHHAGIEIDNLVVSTIFVDEGTSMWRIRPRAQGRASWIQKRSSKINVVLSER